ncbi:hypothetical protein H6F67_17720 [Microcoleus sp. FACHB-1515]|uniref:hypothetical protein n=1 Tax=Cyanophyceae TaxID=3028117 RepID=UPI001685E512|nr:hypothetical protein [Microcoleus sp. FACHB-1515]MBD2091685.1 hypothetical protein [Microcoleus sp. FACHB-1515]
MKISTVRAAGLMVGVMACAIAAPAFAQAPVQPPARGGTDALLLNPQSGDGAFTSDPFSENGSGQMGSVMDLVQRAISGGYMPPDEFNRQQSETINSEASDFRSRQLELLQQQVQPAPVTTP